MSTIHDEFQRQRRVLLTAGKEPTQVVFSPYGYDRALVEEHARGGYHTAKRTYCGLPFTLDPRAEADITVLSVQDVQSKESASIAFRVDHLDPHQTTMEIAGQALSRAQLSDLLQAFVDAHPNEQPMTDMLVDWIQTHGRFE